jgi:pimeloyl-ACP methyl ester carboxylesterase
LQNLDFDAAGTAYWKPNLAVLDASIRTLTGWPEAYADMTYEGPVLAIHGGASHYVDAAGEAAFRRLMPAVAFETLAGAGHWLHAEQPRRFSRRCSVSWVIDIRIRTSMAPRSAQIRALFSLVSILRIATVVGRRKGGALDHQG